MRYRSPRCSWRGAWSGWPRPPGADPAGTWSGCPRPPGADPRAPRPPLSQGPQLAPGLDPELAVDPPGVGPDGFDADVKCVGDLGVRASAAQQLHHLRLAWRKDVWAGGRPSVHLGGRQDVQSSGGEVDRVQDVARLAALGQARGGAEGQELPRLERGGPVGEHDQPDV